MPKDLFSVQAAGYAKHRPGYPDDLIAEILSIVPEKTTAWDCATGNGQAAILLAPHFQHIEATDISQQQIEQATGPASIHYSVSPAEDTPFKDNSFDLITIAQAYHWLSFDAFHKEATRVGRPGAIVAVWGYGLVQAPEEDLRSLILHLYTGIVGPYWDAERKYIDESYRTVPFAFAELPFFECQFTLSWSREDLLGYLNTWSSLRHFIKANGYNPIDEWSKQLDTIWGKAHTKEFSFPLFLRRGRIEK